MPRFVPRQRKHKVRQREAAQDGKQAVDSNQIQILPQSKVEREEKRRKLKEELRAGQSTSSSKKQKRLDKYIENKLRKDETSELLRKLSEQKFDTSQLQSSKNLGKRKHAQFVGDIEPGEKEPAHAHAHGRQEALEDSDLESTDSSEFEHAKPSNGGSGNGQVGSEAQLAPGIVQGSGLRQPLVMDSNGLPLLPTRRKKARRKSNPEISWEGFDSEQDDRMHPTNKVETAQSDHSDSDGGGTSSEEDSMSGTELSEIEPGNDDEEVYMTAKNRIAPRASAFKAWATQQINHSLGHIPFQATDHTGLPNSATVAIKAAEQESTSPNPPIDEGYNGKSARQVYNVTVTRPKDIEESRMRLPIVAEEQKIMEAIHNNACVLIWGTTGSGKTTQVPQFLFEAGYGSPDGPTPGMIGITQPRRVAAVSMAKRVSEELGQHTEKVSYQIRFESNSGQKTAVKFMTDGILLREISQDFALLKYSIIIIDEAHERSVNTDILIGMLSRIVDLRAKMCLDDPTVKSLKLVIMSATLKISDFLQNTRLFPSGLPPLVQAEARQFPVTTHFARRTQRDYVDETFRRICRGHRKLPPGGMLVFLTGQNEIKTLLRRLQETYPSSHRSSAGAVRVQLSASEGPLEVEDFDLGPIENMDYEEDDDEGDAEDEDLDFDLGEPVTAPSSVHVLPLYSQLPTKDQLRVFEPPPDGSRLIVLATNVAETSLTIPGVRYVFDCGRSKERVYDQLTGVQKFEVNWISKSSAEQRAGRAGRTGPGHCYRLYSSAVYERDFAEHAEPEILRTPIESVVLQMKTMGLDNVVNFPFPTPPPRDSLVNAENLLKNLGALTSIGQVTPLGHSLSIYPLSPRYGKMLAIGSQHGCLPYVIALVSGLAVGDVFIPENQLDLNAKEHEENDVYTHQDWLEDTEREQRRKAYNKARAIFSNNDPTSDALKLLSAVCAYSYAEGTNDDNAFCQDMFLRTKSLKEISQLRKQLTDIIRANHPQSIGTYDCRLPTPTPKQLRALNQIVAAGFINHVAIRADLSAAVAPEPPRRKLKRAIDVPYLALSPPQLPSHPTTPLSPTTSELDRQAVYIHPTSLLSRLSPKDLPQYLIYSHLQQSAPHTITSTSQQQGNAGAGYPKTRLFPLTPISGAQLAALAHDTPLLDYGKPIGKVVAKGGVGVEERRECWVVPFLKASSGSGGGGVGGTGGGEGIGWPLPARKVVQVRSGVGGGWVVERFLS